MALDLPDTSVCLNCRYMLRGLETPVCPECGEPFDPNDRTTYTDQYHRGVCYRLTHPPQHSFRYVLIAGTVATLVITSRPGQFLFVPRIPSWCGTGAGGWFPQDTQTRIFLGMLSLSAAIALQHLAMWLLTRRLDRKGAAPPVARLMKWWWAPLCIALVLSTVLYPWPVMMRFQLSRASMENAAKSQLAIGTGEERLRVCGGYAVKGIYIYSGPKDVAFLHVAGSRYGGFIYSPDPTWERDFAHRVGKHWHYTRHWGGLGNWSYSR